jgi:hypothetical protein
MGLGGADDPAGTTWRAVALSPVRPHVGDDRPAFAHTIIDDRGALGLEAGDMLRSAHHAGGTARS